MGVVILGHRRATPLIRVTLALLACGLAALLPAALPAGALAASGDLVWSYTDDSPSHRFDYISAAVPGPNGSMYAAFGWGDDWVDSADLGMYRFRPKADPPGPVVWQTTYDDPDYHLEDFPIAMTTDPKGNAIAGGATRTTPEGMDWIVVKWLADGTQVWTATLGGPAHANDWIQDVFCDRAGNVYACGVITLPGSDYEWAVAKFRASDGKLLWKYVYSGPKTSTLDDWAEALVVDAAGNVYVTGFSENLKGDKDLLVMKLSAKGKAVWKRRVDGVEHGDDAGEHIVLRAGKVYVAGLTWPAVPGGAGLLLARYSTTGTRAWVRTWQGVAGAIMAARGLAVDGAGNAVVAGAALGGTPNWRAFVSSWNAAGKLRWADIYWRTTTDDPAEFNALAVDGKGRIWAASSVGTPGSTKDALLARYQPSGKRLWLRTFDRADHGDDWFNVLTLLGGSSLFAGGVTGTATNNDDVLAATYVR